jgi:arsenate reductase (glutaredoxin)
VYSEQCTVYSEQCTVNSEQFIVFFVNRKSYFVNWFSKDTPDHMIKIYHNPQCKKSREGLKYLQEKGINFEIVEYLKNRLTEKQLEKLLVKLNRKATDVIRTQEEYYKKCLKGKKFNDHEWVRIIVENPKLLQRPVIESDFRAVIGDPAGNMDVLLK